MNHVQVKLMYNKRVDHIIHETQTLKAATNTLLTRGVKVTQLPIVEESEIDAHLEIKFGKVIHQFNVEIKGEIRESAIAKIIERFGKEKDKWLLVAKYIPGPLKDYLKSNGYNYLEETGNCYIHTDNIYLYVNDQQVKHVRQATPGKLWRATGLKFLFVILQDPSMLSAPYRTIANAAGIASGNIADLMRALKDAGCIKDERLVLREMLIDRWADQFDAALSSKLYKGAFSYLSIDQKKDWKKIIIDQIYWAGEPGAALYTNYLVPEMMSLYTTKTGNQLVKEMKIRPDTHGYIQVFEKFWNDWPGDGSVNGAAPPLLIYAGLRNHLDSRNWETAEKIKNLILNDK